MQSQTACTEREHEMEERSDQLYPSGTTSVVKGEGKAFQSTLHSASQEGNSSPKAKPRPESAGWLKSAGMTLLERCDCCRRGAVLSDSESNPLDLLGPGRVTGEGKASNEA